MNTKRSMKWSLLVVAAGCMVVASMPGCELLVTFDRSKIPSDGALGDGGAVDAESTTDSTVPAETGPVTDGPAQKTDGGAEAQADAAPDGVGADSPTDGPGSDVAAETSTLDAPNDTGTVDSATPDAAPETGSVDASDAGGDDGSTEAMTPESGADDGGSEAAADSSSDAASEGGDASGE